MTKDMRVVPPTLLLLFLMLLIAISGRADGWYYAAASVGGGGPFCAGTELFCEDFEGTDTTWDATNGTVDCDGYDADGDYCDDEATVYKAGTEALGIRGSETYYVSENLTSADQTEYYIETWVYFQGSVSFTSDDFGVFTSGGYVCSGLYNNWGHLYYGTKGGATSADTTFDVTTATWYHLGLYYKIETSASANDGIIRVWANTDGDTFDATDIKYTSTTVDTGAVSEGYGGDRMIFYGGEAGYVQYWDNTSVIQGACPWPYA